MLVWCSRPAAARLATESGGGRRSRRQRRQDFQSHAAAQCQLDRLVDDPHAAPAHLAHDLETGDRQGRGRGRRRGRIAAGSPAGSRVAARVRRAERDRRCAGRPGRLLVDDQRPMGLEAVEGRGIEGRSSRLLRPRRAAQRGGEVLEDSLARRADTDVSLDRGTLRAAEPAVDELFQHLGGRARAHPGRSSIGGGVGGAFGPPAASPGSIRSSTAWISSRSIRNTFALAMKTEPTLMPSRAAASAPETP